MAVNQLEKIAGLLERLAPLSGKTRGMQIEADEWNALVDTLRGVLEVDRVQEQSVATALEEKYAPKSHQHLGEVNVEWLDPELQSRLEGGGSPIALRNAFTDLEKKIEQLSSEVTRLSAVVQEQQGKLDAASVKELDRTRTLRGFEERFTGLENLRTTVTTMSGQFQNLSQNVTTVLDMRQRLTNAAGQPFDFADMNRRLTDLQSLRENLRGTDNTLIRARDLDLRLKGVEDALNLGGGSGLPGRINNIAAELETRVNSRFDERFTAASTRLLEEQTAQDARLRELVKANAESAKVETATLVDTRLRATQNTLTTQVDDRFRSAGDQLRRDVTTAATATLDARIGELDIPGRIKTNVDASRAAIETNLRSQLGESLKGTITANIAVVEQTLTGKVTAVEGLVERANRELPDRVKAEVGRAAGSLTTDLDNRIGERLARAPELLEPVITSRVNAAVGGTVAQLNQQVETLVQQRVGDIKARVETAVTDGLRNLPTVVGSEVQARFNELRLDDRLTQMRDTLTTNLTGQVNQSIAEMRAKVTTNEAAVLRLSGELAVAQRTANDANTRALGIEGKLTDAVRNIDLKIENVSRTRGGILTGPRITDGVINR